jgi:membrane fusion protein, copper/silver efflux system
MSCFSVRSRACLLALLALLPLAACGEREYHDQLALTKPGEARGFHCPMHPNYHSDRPGSCPICHMDLVPDAAETSGPAAPAGPAVPGRAAVTIPPEKQQLIGVRLETVAAAPFTQTLRVAARVDVDERRLATVSLHYGGWIEELSVQSVGQLVKPGDALFTVYSPELLEAEKGYVLARGSLGAQDPLLAAARARLAQWDVSEEELAGLQAGTAPQPRTVVHARVGGVVTRRDVTRGARAEPGQTLFELADLSSVWVDGDIYSGELPLVHAGQAATLELVGGGAPIETTISTVLPWIEPATRAAKVRAEIPNPDGRLLPGQFGTLAIHVDLGTPLSVDADAVVQTGERALVFVAGADGSLQPREVVLGPRSGGRIVVSSGLVAGEQVVASGTFLVDSESRLRAPTAQASMGAMPGQSESSAPIHQH